MKAVSVLTVAAGVALGIALSYLISFLHPGDFLARSTFLYTCRPYLVETVQIGQRCRSVWAQLRNDTTSERYLIEPEFQVAFLMDRFKHSHERWPSESTLKGGRGLPPQRVPGPMLPQYYEYIPPELDRNLPIEVTPIEKRAL